MSNITNSIFANFIVILSSDNNAFGKDKARVSIGNHTMVTIVKNIIILFTEVYSKPNNLIMPPPNMAMTEITAIKTMNTIP